MTRGRRQDMAGSPSAAGAGRHPRHDRGWTLSAEDRALVQGLARVPLVSAIDLRTVVGSGALGALRRRLHALQEAGLVDYVTPSSTLLTPQRLYYLTGRGIHLAALAAGEEPATYARRHGLGERALLRRLARLEHLLLTRGFLLDLQGALQAEDGVVLAAWQPWPVRWTYRWQGRRHVLTLDGSGVLGQPGTGDAGGWAAFLLLWDDAAVDVDALRPRLGAVLAARAAMARLSPLTPPFPTLLLVSRSAERIGAARRMARAMARELQGEPLDLLSTADQQLLIGSARGPLDPAVRWQGAAGPERGLLAVLPLRTGCPDALPGRRPAQAAPAPPQDMARGERTGAGLVRGRFAARAAALTVTRGLQRGPEDLAVIALALRPRETRALRWIGVQPLCRAGELAELAQDSPRRMGRTLAHLLALGLIGGELPGCPAIPARRRYVLTFAGLRVLAARAGLAPGAYLRYTGSIAAARVARSAGACSGKQRPEGDAERRRGRYLAWMARYGEHTAGMQALFLQFMRAARATGGIHELQEWRGEWACGRRFSYDGAWQTLRPDAAGRYRAGTEVLSFFVELDRGTYGSRSLRVKLEAYSAYRASGGGAEGGRAFPTILMVTTGEGRLRTILALNAEVAAARLTRPLELLVATREELERQGLHGPIWRAAVTLPPRRLFSAVPRPVEAPAGHLPGGAGTPLEQGFSWRPFREMDGD